MVKQAIPVDGEKGFLSSSNCLSLIEDNQKNGIVEEVVIEMSQQSLVPRLEDVNSSGDSPGTEIVFRPSRKHYVHVAILFIINLLNYMDRFTIAGVLQDIQNDFNMNDGEAGLLTTVFIVSYMLFAPIFGYLGDRYSRKNIMTAGIFVWSSAVLVGTFVPNHYFKLFLLCRACVGIGEASYITVSPTIIADLFTKDMRSKMLMFFYLAVPLGSGLGYIVGSVVAGLLDSWRWGVRVTPILGLACILLIIFVLEEPQRGHAEKRDGQVLQASTYLYDLKCLACTPSFVLSTLGFTCVAFVTGCLSLWTPVYIIYSVETNGIFADKIQINLIFGLITCVSGLAGVAIGGSWARVWRRSNPRADPLVCGIGLLVSMPFLYIALNTVHRCLPLAWVLIFTGITCIMTSWLPAMDLLMYIVAPPRRATASAVQILVSHLLGDAASSYLVGLISDSLQSDDSAEEHFFALQNALFINTFVLVIGGGFFLCAAWYIEKDKLNAAMAINVSSSESSARLPNSASAAGLLREDRANAVVVQGFTNNLM